MHSINAVNPPYNDIRYNNLLWGHSDLHKNQRIVYFFHCQSHVILLENICFGYLLELESPRRGSISSFFTTAKQKSLVTNTVEGPL